MGEIEEAREAIAVYREKYRRWAGEAWYAVKLGRLEARLHRLCPHPHLKVQETVEHTLDARRMRVRYESCPDCGLIRRKVLWKEPVSEKAIWR